MERDKKMGTKALVHFNISCSLPEFTYLMLLYEGPFPHPAAHSDISTVISMMESCNKSLHFW